MTADTSTHGDDAAKVWSMLESIDICMFVTLSESGPHGRPMSTIPKRDEGKIFILTEATSHAATEVEINKSVMLCYQGSGDYVCVSGEAMISRDMPLIKSLWSTGAEAFWPDGPEACNVVAVSIDPGKADYWDGPNRVVATAQFLMGIISQKPPDMGDRGAVNL